MLRLNTIKAQPGAHKKRQRLGRGVGTGRGRTSTKGHKGQTARKGDNARIGFEGGQMPVYRRLPKSGFKNIFARSQAEVNVADLERLDGVTEVTPESLKKAKLVKGRYDRLVVLGSGELTKSLTVKAHRVTASAKEKIEKAGGSVELIPIPGSK